MRFYYRAACLCCLMAFLHGCASGLQPVDRPAPIPPTSTESMPASEGAEQSGEGKSAPATPVPPPTPVVTEPQRAPAPTSAYDSLLKKARSATRRGDYEQALATLERAQRIAPDSAQVYLAMAATHRARGSDDQAAAVAQRGLLYCDASLCAKLRDYLPN